MNTKRVYSIASQRGITSRGTQASLLSALAPVAMAFSVSVAAQVNNEQAQTYITENEIRLDSFEEAFSQSQANVALIRQIGDNNTNVINQNRNNQGSANLASIYQYGSNNDATITQEGTNNTGLIHQNGSHHEASITQNGNQLESQINQSGLNSNVTISHSGSGYHDIIVEQQAFSGNARSVTVETN